MPTTRRSWAFLAAGWLLACASASADPVYIRNGMAVDRAGNTLVHLGSRSQPGIVVLLDASGRINHCGPPGTYDIDARPRRDGAGFLVRRSDFSVDGRIERWDARGRVEWRFDAGFNRDFATTSDGGAVIWEVAFGQPDDRVLMQMVRLDSAGLPGWRSPVYSDWQRPTSVDMHEDNLGRIYFAAEPELIFPTAVPRGTARLGMVNADGRLGWIVEEPRSSLTPVRLLDDGRGDLWWYLGPGSFAAQVGPYRPSQLQRWTPWGLQVASFDGPAMVPGTEIVQPVLEGRDGVWYLAFRDSDPRELVRVGSAGREARHPLDYGISFNDGYGRAWHVQLAAGGGAAWIGGRSNAVDDRLKVQRYTAEGLSWTRFLPGGDEVRGLVVTDAGDARVAARGVRNSAWVARLAAENGHEIWRLSADSLYRECLARR